MAAIAKDAKEWIGCDDAVWCCPCRSSILSKSFAVHYTPDGGLSHFSMSIKAECGRVNLGREKGLINVNFIEYLPFLCYPI